MTRQCLPTLPRLPNNFVIGVAFLLSTGNPRSFSACAIKPHLPFILSLSIAVTLRL